MIKKVLCSLSLLGLFGGSANAQSKAPCGTDEQHRLYVAAHPEIVAKNAALSAEIAEKLSRMSVKDLSPFAKTTDDGTTVYDVPMVFHIIHDYGAEYIPDSDVELCVSDLNKMFMKRNADTINVIAPFKGFIHNSNKRYIGNARITWHLATLDPNGKPTKGITRRRSYLSKTASDLAKMDQWPPNNYMNIWVIGTFGSSKPTNVLAYSIFPSSADVTPYYDGVITKASSLNFDNTIAHELGHSLNMIHTWGNTEVDVSGCGGDDEVDDTPPTTGHLAIGCVPSSKALYDTTCLNKYSQLANVRLDSTLKFPGGSIPAIKSDTSTSIGITFKNRTFNTINAFNFYPSAAVGSTYKIGLMRNATIVDSVTVVSTVKDSIQRVVYKFKLTPTSDTSTNFKLFFMQNPGALRDSVPPSTTYAKAAGTITLKKVADDGFYNFFYNWNVTTGYYKVYAPDSLVDYPDTTNTQNVMDYSHCSFMFTNGQVERMRATLTSTVAKRSSLITPENLAKTGALAPTPALKPKAEYSVEKGTGVFGTEIPYFMCANNSGLTSNFKFTDRTWQAAATTKEWILSNGPTNTTPLGINLETRFTTPGWASVKLVAGNANGTDTFETMPSIYVADPNAINPIGYWQEFTDEAENAKWPIFNYYNNRYNGKLLTLVLMMANLFVTEVMMTVPS